MSPTDNTATMWRAWTAMIETLEPGASNHAIRWTHGEDGALTWTHVRLGVSMTMTAPR